jgi:hypothetical protein
MNTFSSDFDWKDESPKVGLCLAKRESHIVAPSVYIYTARKKRQNKCHRLSKDEDVMVAAIMILVTAVRTTTTSPNDLARKVIHHHHHYHLYHIA